MTITEFSNRAIPFTPRVDQCLRGHVYNESNSRYIVHADETASRYCLPCRRLYKMWTRDVIYASEGAKLAAQIRGRENKKPVTVKATTLPDPRTMDTICVDIRTASKILNRSYHKVWHLARTAQIPCFRTTGKGRAYRIPMSALRDIVEQEISQPQFLRV